MRLWLILSITALLLAASATAAPADLDTRIQEVLDSAGTNRTELETVLRHYKDSGDSLKYQASRFLIGNMLGHCYVTYRLVDSADATVTFDPLIYPDYDSLTRSFGTLEDQFGVLDYARDDKVDDVTTISSAFLIDQVDFAFRAWCEKPWAKKLPFKLFREYVLPYRGSNEPLEGWRQYFWKRYADLPARMKDSTDPIEAARLINMDVRSWFGFDPRYYYHPTDQGLDEMVASGLGRCEDMTNVTIYALRANGIAVTSDYTPYWANTGNNHAWNAVVTPDGQAIPFMGAEADPGEYKLANKAAKVYRKMFSDQPENLFFQPRKQDSLPRWLAGKNYRDVTAAYGPVSDVPVTLTQPSTDSVDIAYLCVFNTGEWQPIQWGRIVDDKVIFKAMAPGIAYLPALYLNGKIVPCADALILHDDGQLKSLTADEADTEAITVASTTKRTLEASTDSVQKSFLQPGVRYTLAYWQNGWQTHGDAVAGDTPLRFDSVPGGGLYLLTPEDSDHEERIFTFENNAQIWW